MPPLSSQSGTRQGDLWYPPSGTSGAWPYWHVNARSDDDDGTVYRIVNTRIQIDRSDDQQKGEAGHG